MDNRSIVEYEDLFKYPDDEIDDLNVWREDRETYSIYGIEIEALIYYNSLQDAIEYYQNMLSSYKEWLSRNAVIQTEHNNEYFYKTNAIEIFKENYDGNKMFCIYTTAPKFMELYDTYWWLYDIIKQMKTISPLKTQKNERA